MYPDDVRIAYQFRTERHITGIYKANVRQHGFDRLQECVMPAKDRGAPCRFVRVFNPGGRSGRLRQITCGVRKLSIEHNFPEVGQFPVFTFINTFCGVQFFPGIPRLRFGGMDGRLRFLQRVPQLVDENVPVILDRGSLPARVFLPAKRFSGLIRAAAVLFFFRSPFPLRVLRFLLPTAAHRRRQSCLLSPVSWPC